MGHTFRGPLHLGPILDGFGWVFGSFIGAFPGIFCSGVDPQQAMQSQFGVDLSDAKSVSKAIDAIPFLKWLTKPIAAFIDVATKGASRVGGPDKGADGKPVSGQVYRYSMFPMKPFDLYKNGNSFGQVWATIQGNDVRRRRGPSPAWTSPFVGNARRAGRGGRGREDAGFLRGRVLLRLRWPDHTPAPASTGAGRGNGFLGPAVVEELGLRPSSRARLDRRGRRWISPRPSSSTTAGPARRLR